MSPGIATAGHGQGCAEPGNKPALADVVPLAAGPWAGEIETERLRCWPGCCSVSPGGSVWREGGAVGIVHGGEDVNRAWSCCWAYQTDRSFIEPPRAIR